jgi:hypothetical protein
MPIRPLDEPPPPPPDVVAPPPPDEHLLPPPPQPARTTASMARMRRGSSFFMTVGALSESDVEREGSDSSSLRKVRAFRTMSRTDDEEVVHR